MADTRELERNLRERARTRQIIAGDEVRRMAEHDAPRDTGQLSGDMRTEISEDDSSITVKLITNRLTPDGRDIAKWQDEGTGVYIGRGRIYPRTPGGRLTFFWPKIGRVVSFKSVAGTPPTHFFTNAVARWREFLEEAFKR